MVTSALIALLGDIYRLALLDFALNRESEVIAAEVFGADYFAVFLRSIDVAGRQKPQDSLFSRNSAWAIGGSGALEKRIYVALRSEVYKAYRAMVASPDSSYRKTIRRFNGSGLASSLAQKTATEDLFWGQIEDLWMRTFKPVPPSAPAAVVAETG
ncbi:MAG TPA: hypothetical protein VG897_03175 [Terriglobales bacterium]|nr:hypothetical protein [Bryobacteraceae bacterium]HVZ16093.1 hypothetical protein [Terriglobales bacterium]